MQNDKEELSVSEILSAIKSNMLRTEEKNADSAGSAFSEDDILDLVDEADCEDFLGGEADKSLGEESIVSDSCSQGVFHQLDKLSESSVYSNQMKTDCVGDIDLAHGLDMLLRQSLKNWMDANLPSIVERIVEKEISILMAKHKK